MKRRSISERPLWRQSAEKLGFRFADMYGQPYWTENACFEFTLRQIEDDIEDPSALLHQMCLDLADRASRDAEMLSKLGLPVEIHDYVAASWRNRAAEPSLYGRFDLAYDGTGPAKMLEYNADTPTGLYETAAFQWHWLEEARRLSIVNRNSDQFNSVHERLIERFKEFAPGPGKPLYFAGFIDNVEDGGTIEYLTDCATQAGHECRAVHIEKIGLDASGPFVDEQGWPIERMFKLFPWEWMIDSEYGPALSASKCQFLEPAWKAMLSTKAILPLLWELHPGHPNLLPAFFDGDPRAAELRDYVRKPLFSREGENCTLVRDGQTVSIEGDYGDGGFIIQEATRLFSSEHGHAVLGSWIVGDAACGLGIREDASPITMNLSRFVPHVIIG